MSMVLVVTLFINFSRLRAMIQDPSDSPGSKYQLSTEDMALQATLDTFQELYGLRIGYDPSRSTISCLADFSLEKFKASHGGRGLEALDSRLLQSLQYVSLLDGVAIEDYRAFLLECPSLETLIIQDMPNTTDLSWMTSERYPKFNWLTLSGSKVSGTSLYGFRARSVQYIILDGSDFADGDLPVLFEFPGLYRVDLENTRVTLEGLQVLRNHPGLYQIGYGPETRDDWRAYEEEHGALAARRLHRELEDIRISLPFLKRHFESLSPKDQKLKINADEMKPFPYPLDDQ